MNRSALPGLTEERARVLAAGWDDGGLWDDIGWLAGQLWAAEMVAGQTERWRHLALAVGNFKRQPGRRLRPGDLAELPGENAARRFGHRVELS